MGGFHEICGTGRLRTREKLTKLQRVWVRISAPVDRRVGGVHSTDCTLVCAVLSSNNCKVKS